MCNTDVLCCVACIVAPSAKDMVLWSPYGDEGMGASGFLCVEVTSTRTHTHKTHTRRFPSLLRSVANHAFFRKEEPSSQKAPARSFAPWPIALAFSSRRRSPRCRSRPAPSGARRSASSRPSESEPEPESQVAARCCGATDGGAPRRAKREGGSAELPVAGWPRRARRGRAVVRGHARGAGKRVP